MACLCMYLLVFKFRTSTLNGYPCVIWNEKRIFALLFNIPYYI